MHAIATIVTPRPSRVYSIMEQYCDSHEWDYASIGGRYHGMIPVGENVKRILRTEFDRQHETDDEFQFRPDEFPHKEKTKYYSCARLRNIDLEEVDHLETFARYGVFNPEMFIVDDLETGPASYPGRMGREIINTLLLRKRDWWYVVVIDYHF